MLSTSLISKTLTAITLTFALAFAAVSFSATAHAQTTAQDSKDAVCQGVGAALGGNQDCTDDEGSTSVDSTLKRVIDLLSMIVSVIAVIMVIIGGFRYVTSQGDSSSTAGARNTIIYAIVGLVIVALAQILVRFALSEVDDANQTDRFNTPDPEDVLPGDSPT